MYRILCYCNYLLFFPQNNKLLIAENASRLSNLFTSIYTKKHLNKIALYAKNIRYGANAPRRKFQYPNLKKIIRFKVPIQSKAIEYFFLQRLYFVQC